MAGRASRPGWVAALHVSSTLHALTMGGRSNACPTEPTGCMIVKHPASAIAQPGNIQIWDPGSQMLRW